MPTLLALDRVLSRKTSEKLGRYELLGRLGAGGMAEVFVARCGDLPGMQSLLAVKRILPHLADDDRFVALFRREAQISLRLRHRAIARVVEVGRVDAAWFLAMELVAGESLSHLLRAEREQGGVVDPRLVAWVGAEIASALHHAHALTDGTAPMEVIHRDVSPQNLLLGFDGAAKLIDFGVARCVHFSDATRTGTVRGKLAYSSPEQLMGRAIDGRSDLFSLAIVLHEWLAGAPLFGRDSDAATVQAVQTAPLPPLLRAPRLGAVLARALERTPDRRYPDGESLAEALLNAVGGRPPSPERLVAEHLGAVFPDRKIRWQAITAGRDFDPGSLDLPKASGGVTVRGTPLLSQQSLVSGTEAASLAAASADVLSASPASGSGAVGAVILARRRVRRRWALALAATAGLASLLINWVRRDRGVTFRSVTPALSQARAVASPAVPAVASLTSAVIPARETAPVASPPASPPSSPPASPSSSPPASPPATGAGAQKKPRHAPARIARSDHRRHAQATPAPREVMAPVAAPVRRRIVDELERSPYTTSR
ncbi:MAG: eukaryotic-like serine/threonine-protein kinase [Myxococcales bacterium]|nr:eukaryotic-like serine/threonine-protein kinase [Myxococcales bacterium]